MRKQHLGYHNGWDCWYFTFLVWFCVLHCWCWQCLLTAGGNWLPHIVTPLDVTTVAWCCRQTQNLLRPAECPPAALQTSKWQWRASVFIRWCCAGSSGGLFTDDLCLQRNLTFGFGSWSNKLQLCRLILSITLHKIKFLPVRVTYHRVSEWMWFLYFTY